MSAAPEPPAPEESALLAAFAASAPAGSPAWQLADALDRIEAPDGGDVPWTGVPPDVWRRGRAARVGERLAGEALEALAAAMAADVRAVTAAQRARSDRRFDAALEALRLVTARLERLERAARPVAEATVTAVVPPPDVSARLGELAGWLGPVPEGGAPVVVGESGAGAMVRALREAGWDATGVEPRGPLVWDAFRAGVDGGVLGRVADHLDSMPPAHLGGLVLAGVVDRDPLAAVVDLVARAASVLVPSAAVVVLTTERAAWEASLPAPALDLAPGRPLHPETWVDLLSRAGFDGPSWHPPTTGTVHAVVARRP
jgi:hypothetical protein